MAFNRAVYNREQLTRYPNKSAQGEVAAADSADVSIVANSSAKFALVVLRIVCNVYVAAASEVRFQADGAGGDPLFTFEPGASPAGLGEHKIEWGETGYQLPPGEGIEVSLEAAGNAFTFLVEAYLIPVATMTPAQIVG